ncbi:MAG: hypothetical protein ABIR51_00820 [Sphingomicrobium sp.]
MAPIPVLCDNCRAAGQAGEAPFADLADLLAFTPVPRRAHVNGWDEERQRAFIAALAVTGSPRRAARAIGKHAFGAQQLRRARGGSGFSAAWDAAIELSRERELAALNGGLTELAAEQVEEDARRRSAILPALDRARFDAAPRRRHARGRGRYDDDEDEDAVALGREVTEARLRIRERLTRARRLLLCAIATDKARRKAWETLVGPVDWVRAERMEAQDDEPFGEPEGAHRGVRMWNMRKADMVVTAEHGCLADITGGPDATAGLRTAFAEDQVAALARLSPEEAEAIARHREALLEVGWTEDEDGNWVGLASKE